MSRIKIAILSIGINYKGQPNELKGCVNDSNNMLRYLNSALRRYRPRVWQMTDALPQGSTMYPTKRNIENRIQQMVSAATKGQYTHIFLHYSGHGAQTRDRSGDESDGMDEALVPADYQRAGLVLDDYLQKQLSLLPPHVRFVGIIDACHSGTIMDLKFQIEDNEITDVSNREPIRAQAMMISGCQDPQFSYDAYDREYGASGAMTSAFLRAMVTNRRRPVVDLVADMRRQLEAKGYPQRPIFSASRRFDRQMRLLGIGYI